MNKACTYDDNQSKIENISTVKLITYTELITKRGLLLHHKI